jgi:hypothetical protein
VRVDRRTRENPQHLLDKIGLTRSCRALTFTETVKFSRPARPACAAQTADCAQAVSSTHKTERQDQSGFLGERNELGRGHQTAFWMPPANQRLGTDDAASPVNLWLVTQEEFLPLQRFPEISLKGRPGGDHGLHLGVKKAKGIATGRLGIVHGQIGPLHQLVDRILLAAKQGDADTRRIVVLAEPARS